MKRPSIVLPHLLAREALDCANVVSNTKYPNQDKHKPAILNLAVGRGILVTNITNFSDLQQYDRGAGLSVIISRLFNTSFDVKSRGDLSLATKKVITYELDDSGSTFGTLCANETFQQWFEKKVKKKDLYFVVGLQTIADAVFGLDSENVKAAATGLQLPTQQAGLDVEATASVQSARARDTQFHAQNEQIYAVQYRKIEFEILSPKDLQNSSLSTKQFWKTYLTTRGGTDEDQYTSVRLGEVDEGLDSGFEVISSVGGMDTIVSEEIAEKLQQSVDQK